MVQETTHIIIAFIVVFLSGFFTALILNRSNFTTDKIVSLLIIGVWLGMHAVGFIVGKEVSWIFDVMGAGSAGHIIGIDLTQIFSKLSKR